MRKEIEELRHDPSAIGYIAAKRSPMDAVRAYCAQCLGMTQWNRDKIEDCQGDQAACGPCPFYPYRLRKRPAMKTFRKFCIDCVKGDINCISECPSTTCPVYPYRFGHNPALIGIGRKAPKEGIEALKRFNERRNVDVKYEPQSTNPLQDDPIPTPEVISNQKGTFVSSTEGRV